MHKNLFTACVIVALGIGAGASSASALTISDVRSQIQTLLAKVAELTNQIKTLQTQTNGEAEIAMPGHHRICSVRARTLSQGTRGDDVSSLQEFLQIQGYFSGKVTGYYGPLTAGAVAKWQASEGVSSVGTVGPLTRARIARWCSNPIPNPGTCKPINYMPIACSDGSQAQPKHNESGCIFGFECPVANYTAPASCKAWNDGCNECARSLLTAPVACTMRACFAAGKGYCSVYFDDASSGNKPPVVSGFSGPTNLAIGETGTWTINASDPEGGQLSYQIWWGDENVYSPAMGMSAAARDFVQTTSFTHAYAAAGAYTISTVVRDSAGQEAKTSSTVKIGVDSMVCTMEYAPVCGQPPEPACRHSIPACMLATPGPQTYSNRCMLNAASATFLYEGQCGPL